MPKYGQNESRADKMDLEKKIGPISNIVENSSFDVSSISEN